MAGRYDAASVAIFDGDAVLLIQRARAPYRGFWTLPGGRILAGESAENCARRETAEELGLTVEPRFVVDHLTETAKRTISLAVFTCRYDGTKVRPNPEVADWKWVLPHQTAQIQTTPGLGKIVALASQQITGV